MSNLKWNLDPAHSELQFKVKHLMITNVTGTFSEISGNAESVDDAFNGLKVNFAAKVASIKTGDDNRDGHLKGADFFDAEVYPEISFASTSATAVDADGNFSLSGDLTIKGVTKSVTLNVEFGGLATDPWGNSKAGFTVSGKINRTDFGLTWNAALETGGVLVSEEVKIHAEIQLAKA